MRDAFGTGTIINVAAILLFGALAGVSNDTVSIRWRVGLRYLLGIVTLVVGAFLSAQHLSQALWLFLGCFAIGLLICYLLFLSISIFVKDNFPEGIAYMRSILKSISGVILVFLGVRIAPTQFSNSNLELSFQGLMLILAWALGVTMAFLLGWQVANGVLTVMQRLFFFQKKPFTGLFVLSGILSIAIVMLFTSIGKTNRAIGQIFIFEILILSCGLMIGKGIWWILRLRMGFKLLGRYCSDCLLRCIPTLGKQQGPEGLVLASIFFCISPIALIGTLQDVLGGTWAILAVKGLMDGLETFALRKNYGAVVLFSAISVLAVQMTYTMGIQQVLLLADDSERMRSALCANAGLLTFAIGAIALDIFEADIIEYTPSFVLVAFMTEIATERGLFVFGSTF